MDDDEMKAEYDFSKGQRGLIVPAPRVEDANHHPAG